MDDDLREEIETLAGRELLLILAMVAWIMLFTWLACDVGSRYWAGLEEEPCTSCSLPE